MSNYFYTADDVRHLKNPLDTTFAHFRRTVFSDCLHVGIDENCEDTPTKYDICEELILHLPNLTNKSVLVLFNPELLLIIKHFYPQAKVTMLTNSHKAANISWDNLDVDIKWIEVYDTKTFFTERNNDMKFDVVIGNPPYQQSNDESSFTNLWADFVISSYQLSKQYVVMITPTTWTNSVTKQTNSSRVFELIKESAEFVNIDECAKYFADIGSTFSYYVLNKDKNTDNCTVVTSESQIVVKWDEVTLIPNNFNTKCISIINKMLNRKKFDYVSSSGTVGKISNEPTDTNKYSVRYAMGTEKFSDTEHQYQYTPKLIFPNQTSKNYPIYAPESAPANRGVFYIIKDDKEASDMLRYIKSAPIQFLISQQRKHHGVLNTIVIQNIPYFDVSSDWTESDIYDMFGITESEIAYINKIVGEK